MYQTLHNVEIPENIDQVYFVVYDGLLNNNLTTGEFRQAYLAMYKLYEKITISRLLTDVNPILGSMLGASPYLAIFIILFLLINPQRRFLFKQNTPTEERGGLLIFVFDLLTPYTLIISCGTALAIYCIQVGFWLFFMMQILISVVSILFMNWLINRPPVIDINYSSKGELLRIPEIDNQMANQIIASRPLKDLEDLYQVRGLPHHIIRKYKKLIMFLDKKEKWNSK